MKTLTLPKITEAPWFFARVENSRSYDNLAILKGNPEEPNKAGVIADLSGRYHKDRNDSEINPVTKANAKAICAIPLMLKALLAAYERAEKEATGYEKLWGHSEPCLCAIRDEYKAALLAAGAVESE